MNKWIKRALTQRVSVDDAQGEKRTIEVEPDEKLVIAVKFTIAMTICLTILEIAHMAILGRWSSEIFAAITALTGTITGLFLGAKI